MTERNLVHGLSETYCPICRDSFDAHDVIQFGGVLSSRCPSCSHRVVSSVRARRMTTEVSAFTEKK